MHLCVKRFFLLLHSSCLLRLILQIAKQLQFVLIALDVSLYSELLIASKQKLLSDDEHYLKKL